MGARIQELGAVLIRRLRREWPWLRWAMLGLALTAVVVAVLGPLPAWLTRHPSHGMTAAERLKAINDVRTTLVQALAGLALLGGLFFTARTFRLGAKNFDLAVQEQLTDRYTKAVEQLGSDKLDVRLGGIYALERLMVDSPRDHPTIVEVLAAFLREHASAPPSEVAGKAPRSEIMPADTDAAARVIARRPPGRRERGPLDLHGCYLCGSRLAGANLAGANFTGANLTEADLTSANLEGAYLLGANLEAAYLAGANLTGANLGRANLFSVELTGAKGLTWKQVRTAATIDHARLPEYLANTEADPP
jgi:hypothetical protein